MGFHKNVFNFVIRKSKEFPKRSLQVECYGIAKAYYPFLRLMKIFGECPLRTIKKDGGLRYEVRYLSLTFVLTVIFGIANALLSLIWILNAVYQITWPVQIFQIGNLQGINWFQADPNPHTPTIIIFINRFRTTTLTLGGPLVQMLQLFNLKSFCNFLNNWELFLQKFNRIFKAYYAPNFNLRGYRNIYCLLWIVPTIYFVIVSPPTHFSIYVPEIVNTANSLWQAFSIVAFRVLFFIRDYLMLKTLEIAYREVRAGIRAEIDTCKNTVSSKQVESWTNLVKLIRRQVSQAEVYQSLGNLWAVWEVFVSLPVSSALTIFAFMHDELNGISGIQTVAKVIIVAGLFGSSLYWKATMAEDVARMEEAIAAEIIEVDSVGGDCWRAKHKIVLLLELMYGSPITFRVGNMFALNRALLLSFFGQVTSYLVILTQLGFHRK